jgi:hypothetical protein
MHPPAPTRAFPLTALAAALGLAFALTAGGARAQASSAPPPDGWYAGAALTVGTDSNPLRRPEGFERDAGTITSATLLGGVDLRPGRQRVYADARVTNTRYGSLPDLDFNGYSLNGGLDWETVARLSGAVKVELGRQLGSYGTAEAIETTDRYLVTTRRLDTLWRLGDYRTSRLWIEATAGTERRVGETQPCTPPSIFTGVRECERTERVNHLGAEVKHRLGGALVIGVGVRGERGDEARGLVDFIGTRADTTDEYDRLDLDLTATWRPTGASTLTGRVSAARVDYELNAFREDRRGGAGTLAWEWQPTGKLWFDTRLAYDTRTRGIGAVDEGNEPAAAFSIDARWSATAKIGVTAGVRASSRRLSRIDSEGVTQRERVHRQGLTLGASYAITRVFSFSCNLSHDRRSGGTTRIEEAIVARDFGATAGSCSAQAVFQ